MGRILAEELSEWFMIVSIIHKLTVGFALLGVINGIFMQETFKVVAEDITITRRQKERANKLMDHHMHHLFRAADNDGDGLIDLAEFHSVVGQKDVKMWLNSMDFETRDVDTVYRLLARKNEGGGISLDDFIKGVAHLKGAARSVDLVELLRKVGVVEGKLDCLGAKLQGYPPSSCTPSDAIVLTTPMKLD